jgi:hypothetical protein
MGGHYEKIKNPNIQASTYFLGNQKGESIDLLAFLWVNPPFEHEKNRATYKYNLQ